MSALGGVDTVPGEPLVLARDLSGVLRPATPSEIAAADEAAAVKRAKA